MPYNILYKSKKSLITSILIFSCLIFSFYLFYSNNNDRLHSNTTVANLNNFQNTAETNGLPQYSNKPNESKKPQQQNTQPTPSSSTTQKTKQPQKQHTAETKQDKAHQNIPQIIEINTNTATQIKTQAGTILQINNLKTNTNTVLKIPIHNATALVLKSNSPKNYYYALSNETTPTSLQFSKISTEFLNKQDSIYVSDLIQLTIPYKYLYIKTDKGNSLALDIYTGTKTTNINSFGTVTATATYNQDKTSGAKYSTLPIIPRVAWGANPSSWDPHSSKFINDEKRLYYDSDNHCRWLPEYYRSSRIVIHHTVTKNYPSDPYRAVREIYLYHSYSRGWRDIGYNFLIDSSGRIFEGKIGGEGTKGYHAFEAANDMSIGISLIGNFTYSLPTSAQLESLKLLMAEKATLHDFNLKYGTLSISRWTNPTYTVFGHRDTYKWDWDTNTWKPNITACPGNAFYNSGLLNSITNSAQTYKETHFDNIKQAQAQAIDFINTMPSSHTPALVVTYNLPEDVDESQVRALVPQYSGFRSVRIEKNKAYISIQSNYDNGYCGYIVPPEGWTGYDACGSQGCMFFPASEGAKDRLKILLTIFYLDPNITDISWYTTSTFH